MLAGVRPDPAHDIRGAHGAGLTRDFMSTPEQGQGRNALDTKPGGDALFILGVELGKPHTWFQLSGRLLKRWCHHLARATPGGPEIDQYRNVVAVDMLLECVAVQFQRMGSEQTLMALAAIGIISQTGYGNAVNGIAVRADNMLGITHDRPPL